MHPNLVELPGGIWLPVVANAFNIFLLKRFFDPIPAELIERPRSDGATRLRILRRIVLPLSRPILAVSIFSIVAVWKDFVWPLLVIGYNPNKQPLKVGTGCRPRQPAPDRDDRGVGDRVDADDRLLPVLPAAHHGRSHRRGVKG